MTRPMIRQAVRRTTKGIVCLIAMVASSMPLLAAEANVPSARYLSAVDLKGEAHHLGTGDGNEAVALVFLGMECPISRQYIPELNRQAAELEGKPVKFLGVISDASTTRADALRFQEEFQVAFPILFDASGELLDALQPTRVPEAFVLDDKARVVYRGRIDDQYGDLKRKRLAATSHELADALAAVLAGEPVEVAETKPIGCPIERPRGAAQEAEVTFTRDIAPILYANCTECHRPGEVAPFSLISFEDAAKRAEFLSEVARERLMPPWKAEIGHGDFLGERRLTDQQIALLEAWAEAGAPEGDPNDLPPAPQFASGWRLGEPDLVLHAPEDYTVPAGGPDIFQHWVIPLDLPEDKTVIGYEFRPGNPAVVHHAIVFLDTSGMARRKDAETPEPGYTTSGSIGIPVAGLVGVWTPGMTPRFFPNDTGLPVRAGSDLVLQLHLHPSGKEEVDRSSVALYFADKPVERTMASTPFVVGTLLIDIPAGSPDHTVTSSVTLPTDVTLISLLPHMHLIGKEMKIDATLPDGTVEPLIWIRDWNFYWQDNYVYREPVKLPAGTRIDVLSRYDNTAENPLNPSNPPQRVLFGNGSTDEMCFGIFQLIADQPSDEMKLRMALMQSFMKQWSDNEIDPEARAHIVSEAGKLFGTENTSVFEQFLGGGRQRDDQPRRERRRNRTGGESGQ